MFTLCLSRFFSLFLSLSLLVAPLPLAAMTQDISLSLSEWETSVVSNNTDESYLYLGKELSNIAEVISHINDLDEHVNSPLAELAGYIKQGFLFAEYNDVIETLDYAATILQKKQLLLDRDYADNIANELEVIIDQIADGALTINANAVTRSPRLRTLVINENIDVLGKSVFYKHIKTKQGIHILGKLKVDKSAKFKKNVTIEGTLSVNDLVIGGSSCIDNLCVNNLSVVDATVDNLTLTGALTFTDLSVVDLGVSGTLSAHDAVINNLTINNCITNVCIEQLSVVDESVNGTLSVNNEIVSGSLNFLDPGPGFVGIQAPISVPISYTVSLPATVPTANQVLRANAITPTNLEWAAESGGSSVLPAVSRMIYVNIYGNDIMGDGSFTNPYATLAQGISVANSLASLADPITIIMGTGIYIENNSTGPLTVTANGVSIVGNSSNGVIVVPNTPTNNFLLINEPIQIINMTFESFTPLATGITIFSNNLTVFENVYVYNFLIGVNGIGGLSNSAYGFNNCLFIGNGTALLINDAYAECNSSTFFGTSSLSGPPANTGVVVTGSLANVVIDGGVFGVCTTGLNITNNAICTASGVSFRLNTFDVVQDSASRMTLSANTFELATGLGDVKVHVSGAGTIAKIISCGFNGDNISNAPQGVGLQVDTNAFVSISGGCMNNYTTAIQIGAPSDSSSTVLEASTFVIRSCGTDVLQQGSSTFNFNASTATSSKIIINNPTNVNLDFFDLDNNGALTIGSTVDQDTSLLIAAVAPGDVVQIDYLSSLYGTKAIGFNNELNNPSSWFMLSENNADLTAITTDRTKFSGLRLVSDTGSPVGGTSALRGWDVNKNGSSAELSFTYQNSDIVGQIAVAPYKLLQLDGLNNQLQLPTASTQIVFGGDTNLYRSSTSVLKTDDNLIVGTLTPDRAVVTAAVSNELASSAVTGTELSYVSGVTSSIQTQLNGKVNKAGDTMTGTLSATDIIANNISVTRLSATDAILQNASIVNLSATDEVVQNIQATNISVVDETVTGTLSVNNAVLQNIVFSGIVSLTDAVIQNLSATDTFIQQGTIATLSSTDTVIQNLTVNNCLTNLCVNNLSVVNESVSGALSVNDEVIKNFLRFNDATGINYVGLQAPTSVPTDYTLALPSASPTINQTLRSGAVTPTDLMWVSAGGAVTPANSRTIYVAKYGNDITGNGSLDTPYLTLSQAITVANSISSAANPVAIIIAAGVYVENNSAGPLAITAAGISIVGTSVNSVIISPNTPANNFLTSNSTIYISGVTFQSSAPLATAITLIAGNLSALSNVRVINFLTGVSYTGSSSSSYRLNTCVFVTNGTAIDINNAFVECNSTIIFGATSLGNPAANTGVNIIGSGSRVVFESGLFGLLNNAFNITGNAIVTINASEFRFNALDIIQSGASQMTLSASTFGFTNSAADVDVNISGAGTIAEIIGCDFNGDNNGGVPQGTCMQVTNNAIVNMSSGSIRNYATGIQIGTSTDTSSTSLSASGVVIINCTTNLMQEGSATLNLNASTAASSKININDPTNVNLAFFDEEDDNALAIGSTANVDTTLLQAAITTTTKPEINYKSSLYSTQAIGFENLLDNRSSWYMLSLDNANLTAITTDRTKIAGLRLVSDEGSPVGGTSALRGWDINKNSSSAELSFMYQNSDIVGQIAVPEYTVMQLDGLNNLLQLPTAGTQIVFGGDTNLYRSSADVLKTDDNFIVGTLTPGRVVITDPITNAFHQASQQILN